MRNQGSFIIKEFFRLHPGQCMKRLRLRPQGSFGWNTFHQCLYIKKENRVRPTLQLSRSGGNHFSLTELEQEWGLEARGLECL